MPGIEREVTSNTPRQSERLVKEKFSPRTVVDNKGFPRTIYQRTSSFPNQSVSFSFRGRYELPVWEHIKGGRVDIGAKPVDGIFKPDEYKNYQSEFRTDPNLLSGEKIHYQTTRDIQGFIRLAGLLAPQNEQV